MDTVSIRMRGPDSLWLHADGNNVALEELSRSTDSVWRLNRMGDGLQYNIRAYNSGMALRAEGTNNYADGNNVYLYPWNGWNSQRWNIGWRANGRVRMTLNKRSVILRAQDGGDGFGAGDNVGISSPANWWGQDWSVKRVEKIDSPTIARVPNGNLVAYAKTSLTPGTTSANGILYESDNDGASWTVKRTMGNIYGPTLFAYDNKLCMLSGEAKTLKLRVSTNGGANWTVHQLKTFADDLESGGGAPVLITDDYLYYAFMDTGASEFWPRKFRLIVASCPTDVDFTVASNWTFTSPKSFPDNPAVSGTERGWLEPNLAEGPDGMIWLTARVNHPAEGNVAARLKLNSDRTNLWFNNRYPAARTQTGFLDAPWAGSAKFHIVYDEPSAKYWVMSNPYFGPRSGNRRHDLVRNTMALYSSPNLHDFTLEAKLLEDDLFTTWEHSAWFTGFQQPAFIIEGNDLLYISRTAYGSLDNYHDANMITFHRKANFR
ncbi:MAG: RICIN domain-containing protein [Planctomycetota bacterium]